MVGDGKMRLSRKGQMKNTTLQKQPSKGLSPEEILDEINLTFQSIFGIKFTKMIDSEEKASVWMNSWREGLRGMTTKEIYSALSLTTQKCKWPPTPAEFRELIEEEIDYEKLFIDACNCLSTDNWTPLLWHSAAKFGRYELRHAAKTQDTLSRFRNIVDSFRGQTLELPEHLHAKQLPAPGQTTNREVARDHLAKLKAIMRGEY